MIGDEKIVEYDKFCKECLYYKAPECSEICNECLNTPVNIDSHKPVGFKEKES